MLPALTIKWFLSSGWFVYAKIKQVGQDGLEVDEARKDNSQLEKKHLKNFHQSTHKAVTHQYYHTWPHPSYVVWGISSQVKKTHPHYHTKLYLTQN